MRFGEKITNGQGKDYSGMYVKMNEDCERRYFSYGGGLEYNKNYKYGEIVMNFIENIKLMRSIGREECRITGL